MRRSRRSLPPTATTSPSRRYKPEEDEEEAPPPPVQPTSSSSSSLQNPIFKLSAREIEEMDGKTWLIFDAVFPRGMTYDLCNNMTDPSFNTSHVAPTNDNTIFPLNFLSQVEDILLTDDRKEFKTLNLRFNFFHRIAITGIFFVIQMHRFKFSNKSMNIEFVEQGQNTMFLDENGHGYFSRFSIRGVTPRDPYKTKRIDLCPKDYFDTVYIFALVDITLINADKDRVVLRYDDIQFGERPPEYRYQGRRYAEEDIERFRGNLRAHPRVYNEANEPNKGAYIFMPCDDASFSTDINIDHFKRDIDRIKNRNIRDNEKAMSITYVLYSESFNVKHEATAIASMFLVMQSTWDHRKLNDKPMVSFDLRMRRDITEWVSNTLLILFRSITEQCTTNIIFKGETNNYFNWSCGTKIHILFASVPGLDAIQRQQNRGNFELTSVYGIMTTTDQSKDGEFLMHCEWFLFKFKQIHLISYLNTRQYINSEEFQRLSLFDFIQEGGNQHSYKSIYDQLNKLYGYPDGENRHVSVGAEVNETGITTTIRRPLLFGRRDESPAQEETDTIHQHPNLKHFLFISKYYDVPFSPSHSFTEWATNTANGISVFGQDGKRMPYLSIQDPVQRGKLTTVFRDQELRKIKKVCPYSDSNIIESNYSAINSLDLNSPLRDYVSLRDYEPATEARHESIHKIVTSRAYLAQHEQHGTVPLYDLLRQSFLDGTLEDREFQEKFFPLVTGLQVIPRYLFGLVPERNWFQAHDYSSFDSPEMPIGITNEQRARTFFDLIFYSDRHLKRMTQSIARMLEDSIDREDGDDERDDENAVYDADGVAMDIQFTVREGEDKLTRVITQHQRDFWSLITVRNVQECKEEYIQLKNMIDLTIDFRKRKQLHAENFRLSQLMVFGVIF